MLTVELIQVTTSKLSSALVKGVYVLVIFNCKK